MRNSGERRVGERYPGEKGKYHPETVWEKMAREVRGGVSAVVEGIQGEARRIRDERVEAREREEIIRERFFDPEKIERVEIDPRLKQPFLNVMERMGEYFLDNGYLEERDYPAFFKEHLTGGNPDKRLAIEVGGQRRMGRGILGMYCPPSKERGRGRDERGFMEGTVYINEALFREGEEEIEKTLCHEFIHFLVAHEIALGKNSSADAEIRRGGFIDEALTEGLAQKIYPEAHMTYLPQVRMMDFANLTSGTVNDYGRFLAEGVIDANVGPIGNRKFRGNVERFMRDRGSLSLRHAARSEEYLEAQRYLIEENVVRREIGTPGEYRRAMRMLAERPVDDREYLDDCIWAIDEKYIDAHVSRKDDWGARRALGEELRRYRGRVKGLYRGEGK